MRNPHNQKSRRIGRTLVECTAVGLFLLGSTAAAQAFTPDVADQVEHFVTCFGLMITDPATHATECGPGHFLPHDPVSGSGTGVFSAPETTTTTTEETTTSSAV